MILKLGVGHSELKLYKVCVNDNPILILTSFTTRSNSDSMHLNGETVHLLNGETVHLLNGETVHLLNGETVHLLMGKLFIY